MPRVVEQSSRGLLDEVVVAAVATATAAWNRRTDDLSGPAVAGGDILGMSWCPANGIRGRRWHPNRGRWGQGRLPGAGRVGRP